VQAGVGSVVVASNAHQPISFFEILRHAWLAWTDVSDFEQRGVRMTANKLEPTKHGVVRIEVHRDSLYLVGIKTASPHLPRFGFEVCALSRQQIEVKIQAGRRVV
jgi:hypothetical protein